MGTDETPELRWFETFSRCYVCGKAAAGILRGSRNESYGNHCQRCADKRLRDSERARKAKAVALAKAGAV